MFTEMRDVHLHDLGFVRLPVRPDCGQWVSLQRQRADGVRGLLLLQRGPGPLGRPVLLPHHHDPDVLLRHRVSLQHGQDEEQASHPVHRCTLRVLLLVEWSRQHFKGKNMFFILPLTILLLLHVFEGRIMMLLWCIY